MREAPHIPVGLLRACLREQYGLVADMREFLPRGNDYRAGVYRVVSQQGAAYLLKVTSRPLYEPGYLVPRYLRDLGIAAVVAPLPTTSGALWTTLAEWTVIVYPFLEGATSLSGMTDAQWMETGNVFRRIHQVQLPPNGFPSLRSEQFDPGDYARRTQAIEARVAQHDASGAARALCDTWAAHQSMIDVGVTSLKQLAAALRSRARPYVICHADLHAANLLRDPAGHVYVLDWDEVMLAPKERDFIFIREPYAPSFWEGYGMRASDDIDWIALTYFRWERVIQDLIEEAQQALFTSDVSEEARLTAAERFAATFAAGGNLDAVYAAAAHLAEGFDAPRRRGEA